MSFPNCSMKDFLSVSVCDLHSGLAFVVGMDEGFREQNHSVLVCVCLIPVVSAGLNARPGPQWELHKCLCNDTMAALLVTFLVSVTKF